MPEDYLTSLELSTRTTNTLRREGVDSVEKFMNLRRSDTMCWRRFGVVSWREIDETQERLRQPLPGRESPEAKLRTLVNEINLLMRVNPHLCVIHDRFGLLMPATISSDVAHYRFEGL